MQSFALYPEVAIFFGKLKVGRVREQCVLLVLGLYRGGVQQYYLSSEFVMWAEAKGRQGYSLGDASFSIAFEGVAKIEDFLDDEVDLWTGTLELWPVFLTLFLCIISLYCLVTWNGISL